VTRAWRQLVARKMLGVQPRGGRSIERGKPVAHSSCSAAAAESRPFTGAAASRGKTGRARIGDSGSTNFWGASRFGTPAARSGALCSHGFSTFKLSVLVGEPIGGAATVCACTPHIGTAADALCAQPSESRNERRVLIRIHQMRREQFAEGIPKTHYEPEARGSRVSKECRQSSRTLRPHNPPTSRPIPDSRRRGAPPKISCVL
jgi:hypothetical protein